jgi:ribosomal protein L31
MPTVLVSDVLATCRGLLGDVAVAGGQVFTDTELMRFFPIHYRRAWRAMAMVENPRVRKEFFYNLPAYTGYVARSTIGVSDLGEIEGVAERGPVTSVAIEGISGTTTVSVTSTAHPFETGQQVVVPHPGPGGVAGVTGIWPITDTGTNTFVLNGAVASGSYTSGGIACYSPAQFRPIEKKERISDVGGGSVLSEYAWNGDALQFPPVATERQIRVVYLSSGTPPTQTTDSIGVDDLHDFLAYATAGEAANAKGAPTRGSALLETAYGSSFFQDAQLGGLLLELQAQAIKTMQRRRNQMLPWWADDYVQRAGSIVLVQSSPAQVSAVYSTETGTISGLIDGVNDTFTIPLSASNVAVYLNGVRLTPAAQYTHSGMTVTFIAPYIPQPAADIIIQTIA